MCPQSSIIMVLFCHGSKVIISLQVIHKVLYLKVFVHIFYYETWKEYFCDTLQRRETWAMKPRPKMIPGLAF